MYGSWKSKSASYRRATSRSATARSRCSSGARSARRRSPCRRARTATSNGHLAAKGTATTKLSFAMTTRSDRSSACVAVAGEAAPLASAVAVVGLGLCRGDRRDVVERVDLSVRMGDGGADLGAPVLEHADVCVRGIRPELASAVDPDRDDAGELGRRQPAERGVVPVRVEHDLAAPLRRPGRAVEVRRRRRVRTERREPVVEDGRVVRKRNLDSARAERAWLRGRRASPASRAAVCSAPARSRPMRP